MTTIRDFCKTPADHQAADRLAGTGATVTVAGDFFKVYLARACGSGRSLARAVAAAFENRALDPTMCLHCEVPCAKFRAFPPSRN